MIRNVVPLSSGYLLTSIVGLMITYMYYDSFGPTWGFTLALFFILMFVSAMISMTYAPSREGFEHRHKKHHERYRTRRY